MQCVYSAFIFRYRLVPTGSENPKVCVRDVCVTCAGSLLVNLKVMFVGAGLLLLSFLHYQPTENCLQCKKREGARAEMVHSETSRSLHCTHRPRKGTGKTGKKSIHTFSLGSSHRWFDYLTEDWCQPLSLLPLVIWRRGQRQTAEKEVQYRRGGCRWIHTVKLSFAGKC